MADKTKSHSMEYRDFGPTGLKVSLLGFGNWVTGHEKEYQNTQDAIFKRCWEAGINFFDTAEIYGAGLAETQFGISIKNLGAPREDLVISTKIWSALSGSPEEQSRQVNRVGLSRKHILEGARNSLRRLQLDYVDVIFCHRPDSETPMEETVRAMNQLITDGKAFYWGTSEWSAAEIYEAYGVADRLGLIRPVVEQCQYNLLHRERFEVEYGSLFDKHKMATTIWSPLAGGILTGKYNNGVPEGSRIDAHKEYGWVYDKWVGSQNIESTKKKLQALGEIAKSMGVSQAQLALGWTLRNRDVSVALFGATKMEQLEDNLKAVEIYKKITPEINEKIEAVVQSKPDPGFNWKLFQPHTKGRVKTFAES